MSRKSTIVTRQTKAFPFQLKDFDDEKGIVRGYLSTFDNIDEQDDRVRKGAFKRTLQNKYEYKKAHDSRYLMPLLWQHKDAEPIGGYTEAKEDDIGLYVELELDLDVQRGKEAYSGLKKGYIFQQSMGYDTINSDYVKIDGKMVRDLIEVRLWEGSIVTFPANEEAVVTDVKNRGEYEDKGVCGNTSGPIGPRDEAWDGTKAKKEIFAAAEKDDGTISASVAKKYFMFVDGDGSKKGDYSYPFWYVGDSPHICVGSVKAIANAIQGARGANAPDGLKSKVEKLYNRINKKYPDDTQLIPPWKNDDKGRHNMERKTVLDHYADEMCQDLLEDWQDVFICSLTCAVLDAFMIGDQPEQDISSALDDFKALVLAKFVPEAIDCNLSDYIADNTYSSSSAEYIMQYGSDSKPNYYSYYASRYRRHAEKAGRSTDATDQEKVDSHVKSLKNSAAKANKAMRDHVKAIHATADTLDNLTDSTQSDDSDEEKAARSMNNTVAGSIKDASEAIRDHADKAMSIMKDHTKAVTTAADDFASTMQGSEPAYGTDPGDPGDDQQEGKSVPSRTARNSQKRSSEKDTAFEADLEQAFKVLQLVRGS